MILLSILNLAPMPSLFVFVEETEDTEASSVMETFDVAALYTNVSNECAMEAIFELLAQHQEAFAKQSNMIHCATCGREM